MYGYTNHDGDDVKALAGRQARGIDNADCQLGSCQPARMLQRTNQTCAPVKLCYVLHHD